MVGSELEEGIVQYSSDSVFVGFCHCTCIRSSDIFFIILPATNYALH